VSPAVVRWRFSPATTNSLRLLVYATVGLTVGPVLGLVGLVGATLVSANDVGFALLVLVLAVVVGLGVGSGRALFALGNAPPEVHETTDALSKRAVVGSVLAGMGLGLWGLQWTDFGLVVLGGSLLTGVAALVVGAGLRTEGVVDCDAGELRYGGHTIPLDAIRRIHTRQLGPFALGVCNYHAGQVGPSTPRWVVLSAAAVEALRAAATGDAPAEAAAERAPTAVRAIAAVFGLGCLALGPLLWTVLPADGRLFAAYLGLFGILFGVVFLRYALVA
jgi:hypothetical protein